MFSNRRQQQKKLTLFQVLLNFASSFCRHCEIYLNSVLASSSSAAAVSFLALCNEKRQQANDEISARLLHCAVSISVGLFRWYRGPHRSEFKTRVHNRGENPDKMIISTFE